MKKAILFILIINAACTMVALNTSTAISGQENRLFSQLQAAATNCKPTPADYLGPFYKEGAPVRASVGQGYELRGEVVSSDDCSPVSNAQIELWLTNFEGEYDDEHRATIYSDASGAYYFESSFPPGYSGRPPHIHIRITAGGFKTLATQHYPDTGSKKGVFDIVLIPTR